MFLSIYKIIFEVRIVTVGRININLKKIFCVFIFLFFFINNCLAVTTEIGEDIITNDLNVSGKIGIGIDIPEKLLHLKSNQRIDRQIKLESIDSKINYTIGTNSAGEFGIMTNDLDPDFWIRNGNIGIGKKNPEAKLDIDGDIFSNGNINISENFHYQINGNNLKITDLDIAEDTTELNATLDFPGLLPKLSGDNNEVLKGDGTWEAEVDEKKILPDQNNNEGKYLFTDGKNSSWQFLPDQSLNEIIFLSVKKNEIKSLSANAILSVEEKIPSLDNKTPNVISDPNFWSYENIQGNIKKFNVDDAGKGHFIEEIDEEILTQKFEKNTDSSFDLKINETLAQSFEVDNEDPIVAFEFKTFSGSGSAIFDFRIESDLDGFASGDLVFSGAESKNLKIKNDKNWNKYYLEKPFVPKIKTKYWLVAKNSSQDIKKFWQVSLKDEYPKGNFQKLKKNQGDAAFRIYQKIKKIKIAELGLKTKNAKINPNVNFQLKDLDKIYVINDISENTKISFSQNDGNSAKIKKGEYEVEFVTGINIKNNFLQLTTNGNKNGNDKNTVLLINSLANKNGDFEFIDNAVSGEINKISNIGNVTHSSKQKKFGETSIFFNGENYLSILDNEDLSLPNEFVIDFWFYPKNKKYALWGQDKKSITPYFLYNEEYFQIDLGAGYQKFFHKIKKETWNHLVITRDAVFRVHIYINGEKKHQYFDETNIDMDGLRIGRRQDIFANFIGYIEEFRISKNTDRGWTTPKIPVQEIFYRAGDSVQNNFYTATLNFKKNFDTESWANINSALINSTSDQGAYFAISFDQEKTWKIWDTKNLIWKNIVRQNNNFWQYNNYSTKDENWINATKNNMHFALSESTQKQEKNRMTKNILNKISDEWNIFNDDSCTMYSEFSLGVTLFSKNNEFNPQIANIFINYQNLESKNFIYKKQNNFEIWSEDTEIFGEKIYKIKKTTPDQRDIRVIYK